MYIAANRFRTAANRARKSSVAGWWTVTGRPGLRDLLDNPASSWLATGIQWVMVLAIIISSVTFCIETMPSVAKYHHFWGQLELIFVVLFTGELFLRWLVAEGSTLDYIFETWTIIDILALLPFYCAVFELEVPTGELNPSTGHPETAPPPDMRILRLCRLMRVFKLTRHARPMMFIFEGLAEARVSFLLLGTMLTLALIFYSYLLFVFERGDTFDDRLNCYVRPNEPHYTGCSPFQNVIMSFWWGMATLSTVGYGEAFPIGVAGKLVTACCMITAILCVALPTTQLGLEFGAIYARLLNDRRARSGRRAVLKSVKEEILLLESLKTLERSRREIRDSFPRLKSLVACEIPLSKNSSSTTSASPTLPNSVAQEVSESFLGSPIGSGIGALNSVGTGLVSGGLSPIASGAAQLAAPLSNSPLKDISMFPTSLLGGDDEEEDPRRRDVCWVNSRTEASIEQLRRQLDMAIHHYQTFLLETVSKGRLKASIHAVSDQGIA
ncbi:unnamed protein product [Amoebophrya sp. A25]|nr:unnamed protein product [Amoebophrya sp. A25]|eukprot:GSA25T00000690001.1